MHEHARQKLLMVTETVLFYTHSSSHLTGIVSKLRFNFNRAIVFFSVYDNSVNFTIPQQTPCITEYN